MDHDAISPGICLDYDDGELSLTWAGADVDIEAVDAACSSIVAACTTRPTSGVYR